MIIFNIFVSYPNVDLSFPFNLPVTASSQTNSMSRLGPSFISLWMMRIWLPLTQQYHSPIVVKQEEMYLCCFGPVCAHSHLIRKQEKKNRLIQKSELKTSKQWKKYIYMYTHKCMDQSEHIHIRIIQNKIFNIKCSSEVLRFIHTQY